MCPTTGTVTVVLPDGTVVEADGSLEVRPLEADEVATHRVVQLSSMVELAPGACLDVLVLLRLPMEGV